MQLIDGRPVYAATDLVGYPRLRPPARARAGGARGPRREAHPQRPDDRPHRPSAASSTSSATSMTCATAACAWSRSTRTGPPSRRSTIHRRRRRATPARTCERPPSRRSPRCASGADVVYQATFFDGTWRGHADFLLRIDHSPARPTARSAPWHYEVADTKLARHVKASAHPPDLLVRRPADGDPGRPAGMLHVVLGGRERPDGHAAGRRLHGLLPPRPGRLRGRRRAARAMPATRLSAGRDVPRARRALRRLPLGRHVQGAAARGRRPEPGRGHLVAPAPRAQGARRRDAPRARRPAAADGPAARGRRRRGARARSRSRRGSRSQSRGRGTRCCGSSCRSSATRTATPSRPRPARPARAEPGRPVPRPRGRPVRARRRHRLPVRHPRAADARDRPARARSDGRRSRRSTRSGAATTTARSRWAAEKAAFERTDRPPRSTGSTRDPALHVYHYAAYERTALGAARAAPRHARGGGRPPAPGRRAGRPVQGRSGRASARASRATRSSGSSRCTRSSARSTLKDAGSSIVAFETWLELGAESPVEDGEHILAEIAGYNRDDVVSNWRLRDWLEDRRRDLEAREGVVLPRPRSATGPRRPS